MRKDRHDNVTKVTVEAEVVVARSNGGGESALEWLAGEHHLVEAAALSRAEGAARGLRGSARHHFGHADPEVLDHLRLVVGVPQMT